MLKHNSLKLPPDDSMGTTSQLPMDLNEYSTWQSLDASLEFQAVYVTIVG